MYIGGENSKFKNYQGNTILIGITPDKKSPYIYQREEYRSAVKYIANNRDKFIKAIEDKTGMNVESLKIAKGKLGVINIEIKFAA